MQNNQIILMAERLSVDPQELHNIVLNTLMPSKQQPTNEQFVSFLAVANEYKLNPLTKEIYAFPTKGGGIQPIVSIDGWIKIINSHPYFDGMEFEDKFDENGKLFSVTASLYNKDRKHPTTVTEYMSECAKPTEPWQKWPARMLRHKALIQAARYAFGFSGIVDPDEGERFQESQGEVDITPQATAEVFYSDDDFTNNLPSWLAAIQAGKLTLDQVIMRASTKASLTDEQKQTLRQMNKKQTPTKATQEAAQ